MNSYIHSQMIYNALKMINKVSRSSSYIRLKYQIYAMMNYTIENKMPGVKMSNLYSSHIFIHPFFFNRVSTKIDYYNLFKKFHIF